jgi:hypothetical protein
MTATRGCRADAIPWPASLLIGVREVEEVGDGGDGGTMVDAGEDATALDWRGGAGVEGEE